MRNSSKGARRGPSWATQALKEMRETGLPIRLTAVLKGPIFRGYPFAICNGDTIELSPICGQPSYFWTSPEWPSEPTTNLVLVRWTDGHFKLAIDATRKGPYTLGEHRLHFMNSRGRYAWIGPKHQLAIATKVKPDAK